MIRVANAPVSWGVIEFDVGTVEAPYPQVLDEIRETGYRGTELGEWGFLPTDPDALRQELRRRQLELLGAFVAVALARREEHEAGVAAALRAAELMAEAAGDHPFVVLSDDNGTVQHRIQKAGRILPQDGLSGPQWEIFAQGAERIAEAVRERTGLRTVFHHHCAGYVETHQELQTLLALTDPELLGLCLDTGHFRFGGGDPAGAVERYGGRIWHMHFKDCQPERAARSRAEGWDYFRSIREGVFCELGQGEVDFAAVLDRLAAVGYSGWIVVEQDVLPGMGTPKESAARNRAYLRRLGV